jgi:RNA recognition motif-containing protein
LNAASFVQHVYCEEEEEEADNSHTKSLYELFILCNYLAAAISQHITKIIIPDTNEIGGALLQVQSVKIIRNKQTGYSEGYGFVEFISHASAEKVLQAYNGTLMPNTEQPFRLNWASFGIGERRPEAGTEHSIFVGDLAPDVTDYMLQEIFRTRYPSVKGAKVVTDANTGRSKGYGFVRFGEEMERNRAMNEMNGVYCSSRPMRISAATPKKALGPAQQHYSNGMSLQTGQNQKYELDIKASIPFLEAHSVAIFHISLHPSCIPNFQTLNSLFLAYIWC